MLFPFSLYADDTEARYALSSGFQAGILWGKGKEIVYPGIIRRNSSPYVSELLWDFKPLFYTGINLDYSPRNPFSSNGFHISLDLKYGLPLNTGIIENRDWMANGHDYLTHYSRHDAFSDYSNVMADLAFGYSFALLESIWIKPYTELSFMRFSWFARDGYGQYGYSSPGIEFMPSLPGTSYQLMFSGKVITYSQNWVILAIGFETGIKFNDNVNILLSTAMSPIVYGFHRDDHLHPSRQTTFLDFMFGGLYIKGALTLEYMFNRNIALSFSAAYMDVSRTRGDTYISYSGTPYIYYPNIAGAGFSFTDYSLGIRYIF